MPSINELVRGGSPPVQESQHARIPASCIKQSLRGTRASCMYPCSILRLPFYSGTHPIMRGRSCHITVGGWFGKDFWVCCFAAGVMQAKSCAISHPMYRNVQDADYTELSALSFGRLASLRTRMDECTDNFDDINHSWGIVKLIIYISIIQFHPCEELITITFLSQINPHTMDSQFCNRDRSISSACQQKC